LNRQDAKTGNQIRNSNIETRNNDQNEENEENECEGIDAGENDGKDRNGLIHGRKRTRTKTACKSDGGAVLNI
jgi:hypothetical protein